MQLIKSRPGNLPMRFLVEIAKRHGVGQQLVKLLGHFEADRFLEFERESVIHGSIRLNFTGTLVKARLGGKLSCCLLVLHRYVPSVCHRLTLYEEGCTQIILRGKAGTAKHAKKCRRRGLENRGYKESPEGCQIL
jgi:hypothetical protein